MYFHQHQQPIFIIVIVIVTVGQSDPVPVLACLLNAHETFEIVRIHPAYIFRLFTVKAQHIVGNGVCFCYLGSLSCVNDILSVILLVLFIYLFVAV